MNPLQMEFRDDQQKFGFLFLSAVYGLFFFQFFVLLNPPQPEPKPDFKLFILAWTACPALGLVFTRFFDGLNEAFFRGDTCFYPLLLFTNLFFILVYQQPNWGFRFFEGHGWAWLGFFFVVQAIGAGVAQGVRKMTGATDHGGKKPQAFYNAAFVLVLAWVLTIHGFTHLFRDWKIPNYLFFAAVCFLFYFAIPFEPGNGPSRERAWVLGTVRIPHWIPVYGVVFLLITFLVVDPYFPYQRYHCSYYLGPLTDLLDGKSLLVNINAQYGVLVFYFLSSFFHFLPIGYTSFSWVNTMLIVAQYCVFYFVARSLFRSGLYSFLCLLALLVVNHFAQIVRPTVAPSSGPLRFGFIYAFMLLALLRNRYPTRRNLILWLESASVGVAVFWSYDVCFYTIPPYLLFVLFETVRFEKGIALDGKALGGRLLKLAACTFLTGAFLYMDVYRRSGEWPHWSYYLNYIFLYENGKSVMPRPDLDYWCLIAGTLYFSAFALLGAVLGRPKEKALPENMNVVALVTFYGIFQYLYFVYRSHPNNLFHISMPSILLFAYLLNYLRSEAPSFIPAVSRKIAFGLAVLFIGAGIQALLPTAISKVREQLMPPAEFWDRMLAACRDMPRDDGFARQAEALMRKYSGNKKVLPYFFGYGGSTVEDYADLGLEVSMYDHRVKPYPYNDLSQANICPPAIQRIESFDPGLQKGDCVYYRPKPPLKPGDSFDENIHFENDLAAGLSKRYDLKRIDQEGDIEVYRIQGPARE